MLRQTPAVLFCFFRPMREKSLLAAEQNQPPAVGADHRRSVGPLAPSFVSLTFKTSLSFSTTQRRGRYGHHPRSIAARTPACLESRRRAASFCRQDACEIQQKTSAVID